MRGRRDAVENVRSEVEDEREEVEREPATRERDDNQDHHLQHTLFGFLQELIPVLMSLTHVPGRLSNPQLSSNFVIGERKKQQWEEIGEVTHYDCVCMTHVSCWPSLVTLMYIRTRLLDELHPSYKQLRACDAEGSDPDHSNYDLSLCFSEALFERVNNPPETIQSNGHVCEDTDADTPYLHEQNEWAHHLTPDPTAQHHLGD